MPLISPQDREYLRERFSRDLREPVSVTVYSEPAFGLYVPGRRECQTCRETEALMQEVAEISGMIRLEIVNVRADPERAAAAGVELTPTIVLGGDPEGRVRFLGLPGGLEFTSFVETVVSAGSGDGFGLQPETLERLASLEGDLDIKTFVTPT